LFFVLQFFFFLFKCLGACIDFSFLLNLIFGLLHYAPILFKDAILFTMCFLQLEKAVEILDEMTLAGVSPNEHTYTTIMHGYASLGDTGKAFEYFTKLRNEGLELDVYTYEALLKACCKSGRMQSALAVTKEMSAQKIPKNTFVYNILIDGYELSIILEVQQIN
jgi:pentatricopeptide repeat protein